MSQTNLNLTQTILKLLQSEDQRELVNKTQNVFTVNVNDYAFMYFDFDRRAYAREAPATSFESLLKHEQREVIRVCLEVLPFFERENPEYTRIDFAIGSQIHTFSDQPYERLLLEKLQSTPKTLRQKYQHLLYLPIPELDAEFEKEGVTFDNLTQNSNN